MRENGEWRLGLKLGTGTQNKTTGGNIIKLKKCAIPNTLRLEPSCSNTQDFPTASSTTAIDTYEQMEHVPHHEAVETLSRNTKLSRSTDPLTEVSMSWSNRSGNRSEVNTKVNAFTPVYSNLSKEQSHAEDQLNTFTSTPKKVFTNKTMKAANHFPMNMTSISKEYAKAGDELTILTSRRSPLSQKSTSHKNIGDLLDVSCVDDATDSSDWSLK
ncbi:hypothetical protein JTB14_024599 [Gonioctena quinquepunctata]|nr:hypothetical protein JTB14_024599 [Gonioctena quinquepunctata]